MIDNLYDHRTKFICTAEVSPEKLFCAQAINALDDDESRTLSDDLDIELVMWLVCFVF